MNSAQPPHIANCATATSRSSRPARDWDTRTDFPLSLEGSAPSLFNVNAQSALLNPSLRQFLKAAKVESSVASLKRKDQRNQIIQDAALSYAELAKWEQRLAKSAGHRRLTPTRCEAAVAQRVKEGVDSEIEGTKARLSAARVRLRIAEAQGAADVLREHLSKLTGLAAADIQTDPDSIPAAAGACHSGRCAEGGGRLQSRGAGLCGTRPRTISARAGRASGPVAERGFRCAVCAALQVQ